MLSRGQQGPPAVTSARPVGLRHSGGPGCKSTPGSQGPDTENQVQMCWSLLADAQGGVHHSLQAGPGPCALLAWLGSALCVPFMCPGRESARAELLCQSSSAVWSWKQTERAWAPGSVRICLPAAAQDLPGGTSLCWGSYLMYHQPSNSSGSPPR